MVQRDSCDQLWFHLLVLHCRKCLQEGGQSPIGSISFGFQSGAACENSSFCTAEAIDRKVVWSDLACPLSLPILLFSICLLPASQLPSYFDSSRNISLHTQGACPGELTDDTDTDTNINL
jgi:hypothetical protein